MELFSMTLSDNYPGFKVTVLLKSNIKKVYSFLETDIGLWDDDRKPSAGYPVVTVSMTFCDP